MADHIETTELADTQATTATLSAGDTLRGSVVAGDGDWIKVTLTAGNSYTFAMTGVGAVSSRLADSFMSLLDASGQELVSSDNEGPGQYSLIKYTPLVTGTYYINAQSVSLSATGDYMVSMASAVGDVAPVAHFTQDMAVAALSGEGASWALNGSGALELTWGQRATLTDLLDAAGASTTNAALDSTDIAAVNAALSQFSSIINATFTDNGSTDDATLLFSKYNSATDGAAGGYANLPGSTASGSVDGDVRMNSSGGISALEYLQAIGTALGLSTSAESVLGRVLIAANAALSDLDSQKYSVMSSQTFPAGTPDTLMLYDILALQQLYGANNDIRSGDTTYGFNASSEITGSTGDNAIYNFTNNTDPVLSIWDGGGLDTLDLSGDSNNNIINLKAGTFSSVMGKSDNISIAFGAVIENAVGGSGDDTITGNDVANSIVGGSGADTIDGGAGVDTLNGGLGNDTYYVDVSGDVVSDTGGTDTVIYTGTGTYTLATGNGIENLTLTGTNGGGTGNELANTITGNAGNNIIDGGAGTDTLVGGAGNDTYYADVNTDVITEGASAGTDTVVFTGTGTYNMATKADNVENLILSGANASNATGNALDNKITGNAQANVIDGGAGDDQMIGGDGGDTYEADSINDWVVEQSGDTGTDLVNFTGANGETYVLDDNVENLTLLGANTTSGTGNAGVNTITGNAVANTLTGAGGNDTLVGLAGDDVYVIDSATGYTITEGAAAGTDTIKYVGSGSYTLASANVENLEIGGTATGATGDANANLITGNAFANTIDGGGGADTLAGGDGNDTYIVDEVAATDVVTEAASKGTDTVKYSGTAAYTLGANIENLTLTNAGAVDGTGNAENNVITGNAAINTLDGTTGSDTLIGGGGADIFISDGGDVITGGAANDTVKYTGTGTFSLADAGITDIEDLELTNAGAVNGTGTSGANKITGNAAANIIDGNGGADTLIGGGGNDIFITDGGDTITGGAGTDTVRSSVTFDLGDAANTSLDNLELTGSAAIDGTGTTGDNVLKGNSGANTLTGLTGNDTYYVGVGDTVVEATGEGTDIIWFEGNAGETFKLADTVFVETINLVAGVSTNATGNAEVNTINGNEKANVLDGGDTAGALVADSLNGGLGDDTYIADLIDVLTDTGGIDTVVYNAATAGTTFSLATGATIVGTFENLTLAGSLATNGTGNASNNVLTGNSAANVLVGGLGDDIYVVDAADTVTENASEGTDEVQISATEGTTVTLSTYANVENLTLLGFAAVNATGSAVDNVIKGTTGDNVLDGAAGKDTLIGGKGDDTYIVDVAEDVVTELANEGTDTVKFGGTSGIYTLSANVENLILTGTSGINGAGNDLANTLTGNSGANQLSGGAGADTIDGGAGIDTMIGGLGSDVYYADVAGDVITEVSGGGNADKVYYSGAAGTTYTLSNFVENLILSGTDNINGTGNGAANLIVGNAGDNILEGGFGIDTLNGGAGDDTYVVDSDADTIIDSSGTDTVKFTGGNGKSFTLGAGLENLVLTVGGSNGTGNATANTITGSVAANLINGGAGNDTINAGGGNDTVYGGADDDVINGEGSNDMLYGDAGNDSITGGFGQDTLTGGTGTDTLAGGTGDDTYMMVDSIDVVTEALGEGIDTVSYEGAANSSYTLTANVEKLVLTGTNALDGVGNDLGNTITGNSAANSLSGGLGNDTLEGGAGNDTLDGGADTDQMSGGLGNDVYAVDDVTDVVIELADAGIDKVLYSGPSGQSVSSTYTLGNNVEELELSGTYANNATGNSLNNKLTGNVANNILDGGIGADTMAGGDGDDTYRVDNVGDVVTEASNKGTDTVEYTGLAGTTYTLGNNVENLTLSGSVATNGTGNDLANVLTGNAAANTLDGGIGADTMRGGAGDDTYNVDNELDVIEETAGNGNDTVNFDGDAGKTYILSDNVENLVLTGKEATNGVGNAGANTITGNDGNNVLNGGLGADTLTGGKGNDVYVVDNQDIVVEAANAGTDTVQYSGAAGTTYTLGLNLENLKLSGANAINATGNAVANVITGNSADNVIDGGLGSDTMRGGAGDDTYFADVAGDFVSENANAGTDTVKFTGTTGTFTLGSNVENLILMGTAATSGTGNSIANTITGNSGANTLDGGAGRDTLIGGKGDDTYVADNVGDVVTEVAGEGKDTVQFTAVTGTYVLGDNVENLTLSAVTFTDIAGNAVRRNTAGASATGNDLANTLTGDIGQNTLDGGAGIDTLIGGKGDDTYIVDVAGDVVTELANTGTGPSLVDYGSDTVIFKGVAGATYTLGANIETLNMYGPDAATSLALNGVGNATANTLNGNYADNSLNGGGGNDTLNGGEGNDTLDGGIGTDSLVGGLGDDIYVVDVAADVVSEAASEGTDTVQFAGTTGTYIITDVDVENLTLLGTAAINGTGNSSANVLTGNSGANTLDGLAGDDTMIGGAGDDIYIADSVNDVVTELADVGTTKYGTDTVKFTAAAATYTLSENVEKLILAYVPGAVNDAAAGSGIGNALANTITGNNGQNTLDGGAGIDTLIGGKGDDTYRVDDVKDVTTELTAEGTDTVEYTGITGTTYTLGAFVENLTLMGTNKINGTGNTMANTLTGNSGNNVLDGGTGADTMDGKDGNDTYYADVVADTVAEAASTGTDTVYYTGTETGTFTLGAGIENLVISGTAATKGTGQALDNTLTGNLAANVFDGAAGNDTLDGGLGNDTLTGGADNDTFVFSTALGATNVDTIADFVHVDDTIQLSSGIFTGINGLGTLTADQFLASSAAVATDEFQRIILDTDDGKLYYDTDGNGSAVAIQIGKITMGGGGAYADINNTDFFVL